MYTVPVRVQILFCPADRAGPDGGRRMDMNISGSMDLEKVQAAIDTFLDSLEKTGPSYQALMAVGKEDDDCVLVGNLGSDPETLLRLFSTLFRAAVMRYGWNMQETAAFMDIMQRVVLSSVAEDKKREEMPLS